MKISRVLFSTRYREILDLFRNHWDEIGLVGSSNLDLNIDYELYCSAERENRLFCVICENDNKIVGYLNFFIYNHPHNTHVRFATTDCLYLDKKYRGLVAAKYVGQMFRISEIILKEEYGVDYVQFVFSVKNDLTRLAERLRYTKSDIVCLKKL